MNMGFDMVYYEPAALDFKLGKELKAKFSDLPWLPIESHNYIPELASSPNSKFTALKNHLIIGIRKTHKYVENHKVSDWLVPFTSSGCQAMCLYCYLVCNYNKCAYLRLFVNREQMMEKLLKKDRTAPYPQTFEIGSNSDLILENTITNNLIFTIENFASSGIGNITFPTKFSMVEPLLNLNHQGKVIFRMSVNPKEIINQVELGTSGLSARIKAVNAMAEAGYPVGILIAPVILLNDWKKMYSELTEKLADELSPQIKKNGFIEVILMTYSFVQNAINTDAFPNRINLLNKEIMSGSGRGKYRYKSPVRLEAEEFLMKDIKSKLPEMNILYLA